MKRISTLLATLCLMQSGHAQTITTAVPGLISYQGRALNSAGTVMGSGTPVNRTVTFRIWDHSSNSLTANLIYSEQQVVTIAEGEFSVLVGAGSVTAGTPLGYSETGKGPPTVRINDLSVFAGVNRFLGVTIDDGTVAVDNEVSPRQQIVSSAYALRARYAEQLGSNGGTALTALDSGNVGIGNTSPPSRFTVTAAGTGTSTPQMIVTADDVTERLRIGVDSTGTGTGYIQSFKEGIGAQNLLLNPNGGNVSIGSSSPGVELSVVGMITGTGAITGGSFSTAGAISATGAIAGGSFSSAGAITATGAITGGSFGTAGAITASGNIITSGGNVGIGTTTPGFPLSMSDAMGDKIALWGKSGNSLGFGIQNNLLQIHTDTIAGDIGFGYGSSAAMTETMRIKGNGKVGIGTNAPGFPLNFASNLGDKISLYGNSGAHFGLGVQNNQLQIHTDTNAADVVFGFGTSSAMTETMRIKGNGYVGIGTTTPGFPLTVTATANGTYTGGTPAGVTANSTTSPGKNGHDAFTVGGTYSPTSFTWPTAISADGAVAGSAFVATSDLRIKDIVSRSSTRSDLALINQLQVTDYRLKDSIANGTAIRKGFIAQEVRKIIPEAVSPSPGYIPDIYVLATQSVYDAAQKRLSVTLAKPHELAVGEWVRIYGGDNTMETKVLTVESVTSFTVASEKPVAKAFVYGRRVDDFLTVDYDRLFTTGIGAIQDLARQLATVQAENAALRLELAAKEESMEARLIALEARLPKDSSPAPVSLKTVSTSK